MSISEGWGHRLRRAALDAGFWGQSSYTRFIILGRSRVGSNLLRGLLNAHPQVIAYGEVFRDRTASDWDHTGHFQTRRLRRLAREQPVRFLESKLLGRYPRAVQAVGFKLFYYHARDGAEAGVWPYLRERADIRVIHLRRRNLLQTHLSRTRAALTDRWVNTSGQPDAPVVVSLDYEECVRDFEQTRAWEREADRYFVGHPVLPLDYEDLIASFEQEALRIQHFLQLPPRAMIPSTYQQARQPLSATIANYAALKARFVGTEWAQFFTD